MPKIKKNNSKQPPSDELLQFLDDSVTPHHVFGVLTATINNSIDQKKLPIIYLNESSEWQHCKKKAIHVVKRGASYCLFMGDPGDIAATGIRILAAHTDSPGIRLKPSFDITRASYPQLAVESYGGLLLSTWLDRPLALAGQIIVPNKNQSKGKTRAKQTATTEKSRLEGHLVNTVDAIATIPNLAIHLSRDVNKKGLVVNQQRHLSPLTGSAQSTTTLSDHLLKLIGKNIKKNDKENKDTTILGHELWLYDNTPAQYIGLDRELVQSARLDNLASCWSALHAFIQAAQTTNYPIALMLYNHEECGSRSDQGASSPFFEECLERWIGSRTKSGDTPNREDIFRAKRNSFMISADMTHALHPNYPEAHEPTHAPVLGGGIAIKHNYNQSYATEALGSAILTEIARRHDIPHQTFVSRSDKRCGTTIGPISAAVTGIRTIDVGAPMLGMHSCKETAAISDIIDSIPLFTHFLTRS